MRKQFSAEVKELSERGEGMLRMATLGIKDHDRDITLPGFFGRQYAPLLPTHTWSHIPLGKGVIFERDHEAIFHFQTNMELQSARDWYSHLKFDLASPPSLQEVSYGFSLKRDGFRVDMKDGEQVRYLIPTPTGEPGCKVHEVSFVLVGAGVGTGVIDVKCDGCGEALKPATCRCHEGQKGHEEEEKQEGWTVQTLIFPKDKWDSASACQKWCRDHDFSAGEADETDESWRFRQRDPGDFERLRTICMAPGRDTEMAACRVKAVGGPLKKDLGEEHRELKLVDELDDLLYRIQDVMPKLLTFSNVRADQGRSLPKGRLDQVERLISQLTDIKGLGTAPLLSDDRAPLQAAQVAEFLARSQARAATLQR